MKTDTFALGERDKILEQVTLLVDFIYYLYVHVKIAPSEFE